ncbi:MULTISPECIES: group I intron-associated PD-(D/E)XK endonuclease [Haloarcula]|uniref:PD(D/E)XK endonuclease domain-containing protein n=1 Tax=Haloarcula pellucida TaxID=1427151 RepID=A0A830GME1_9EURY|nr:MULTISPECIES: group I intron-associated PD-(D/E)XK endonuclease [Halomicroarcula]MBX0349908.1 hypothetical protein [Halomicroarcula pellucida]MDS0279653.1 group I intron-associated PD-(D/E)XK endonuclease [Halomicroarcula sp. S1AR25-4]GGN94934.1 hypothetical protein GCM10009030_21800 [Halomicroarcula pellucida]
MGRNQGHVDGELAEFAVAAALVSNGCRVSYTHGEYKYDLVADADDELLRVQVKKANRDTDTPWKYRLFTDQYDEGQVDLFAGYIPESGETFYATADEVGSEFRINAKSGEEMNEHNRDLAKLVGEYTFERAVSRLRENELTEGGT